MNLITILSLVFLGITHSQQVSKKYAGHALLIPMHIRIPIFNDKEKTSIISYVISKHSKKCTFYTLRFGCSFAAVNTIKPQLL